MNIVGRLKPGITRAQAEVAMNPLWHALRADELKALGARSKKFTDEFLTNSRMRILPGARGFSYDRDDYQTPLLAVMTMAALVLLIAAVNVASLLLVRSANRMREFSIRFALGANAARIFQQLLLEGLLIGMAGGAAGLLIAGAAIRGLVHQLAGRDGSSDFVTSIDGRLLIFNFAAALIVSVFFSLAPAMQSRRPNLSAVLGQRSATGGGGVLTFRRVVVCLQIGLSVVLLVGAGLFVRTMQKLRAVDVGFNTSHLIGFGIDPKLAGYPAYQVSAIDWRVLDTLATLPGIQSVAATSNAELAGQDHGGTITLAGYTPPPDEEAHPEQYWVSEGYFSTLQVPLLAGRAFNEADGPDHPRVAIVNDSFVRKYCGSPASCLGRMAGSGGGDNVKLNIQIVGIARDIKHRGVRDLPEPTMFFPAKQQADPASMFFYLRTYGDPAQTISAVRRTMQQLYPRIAIDKLGTMEEQIQDDLSNDSLVMLLAIAFGLLAASLSGVGIYGVLAYSTAQRKREIGIRIALGSSRIGVARIILADVLLLAAIGIAVALPTAYALSHLIRNQLYGVSPADPLSLVTAVFLVAVVALIAALIPATRAAAVDPTEALRAE
jgi:predicted permease